MLRTRVMPCLLLKNGRLVKTVKFKNPQYVGDPVNAVRIYNEKEVDDLVLLDIGATVDGTGIPIGVIGRVASECFMPLTYGGGVRTLDDVQRVLAAGVEKIAVNTGAIEDPEFVARAAALVGSASVMVSIDVRRRRWRRGYEVCARSGTVRTGIDPAVFARRMQDLGAGELLLNAIDRDGTMSGYDIDLVRHVTGAVSVPVIACGGAGCVEDFGAAVKQGGASAAAAGSLVVYQGPHRAVLINFPSRQELDRVLN
jgi:imidazole glycerol-phosphate synthase subunit HisF